MERRTAVEAGAGAVAVAIAIAIAAMIGTGFVRGGDQRELFAEFGFVGDLAPGSDVRMGGIKVGIVTSLAFDPEPRKVRVRFLVDSVHEIPDDSVVAIVADGLLGGAHLRLDAGRSDKKLWDRSAITKTDDALDIAEMVRKVIVAGVTALLASEETPLGQ